MTPPTHAERVRAAAKELVAIIRELLLKAQGNRGDEQFVEGSEKEIAAIILKRLPEPEEPSVQLPTGPVGCQRQIMNRIREENSRKGEDLENFYLRIGAEEIQSYADQQTASLREQNHDLAMQIAECAKDNGLLREELVKIQSFFAENCPRYFEQVAEYFEEHSSYGHMGVELREFASDIRKLQNRLKAFGEKP